MARLLLLPPARRGRPPLAAALEALAHEVVWPEALEPGALLAACDPPPDAAVIDLRAAPATGRDLALWLRGRKLTKSVPLLLVAGEGALPPRLGALLPDAIRASGEAELAAAVASALRAPPPPKRGRPASALAGYSGTPLPKKLGIGPDVKVVLLDAPEDFARILGPLPEGARLAARGAGGVVMLFVRSRQDLERRLAAARRAMAEPGRLWIAWPKKSSGVMTDVTESDIRARCLRDGLVDYKVCAIDAVWSGLCFARRRG